MNTALTIGNFDGVHLGHKRLIHRVLDFAREHDLTPALLTFDPHPARVVAPDRAPRLLTTLEQRINLLHAEGIEHVEVLPFTAETAKLTPEEFVTEVVVARLSARAVVVGHNFRFGNKAAGDVRLLRELGRTYAFETDEIDAWTSEPTPAVLAAVGVAIAQTADRNGPRQWRAVPNVGYRPAFGSQDRLTIETFLLEPLEGPSPRSIGVEFLKRLREERKFENAEALKKQILRDVQRAEVFFKRTRSANRVSE